MGKINWQRLAAVTVCVAGALAAIYVLCNYVFVLFLPFLLAFFLSLVTRGAVCRLSHRCPLSRRLCAALVTLGALFLIFLLLFLLCNQLLRELQNLLEFLGESASEGGEIARVIGFFRTLGKRIPLLSHLLELELLRDLLGDPEVYLRTQLQALLEGVTGAVGRFVGAFLRGLPGVALFFLVTVIACFYFAMEYEAVVKTLYRLLPRAVAEKMPAWRERAGRALRRCVSAYLWLFLLTLTELTVGFLLLRVRYPLLLAFISALLDILPVLGVGTVLLPWGAFLLISGQIGKGIGVLVLYAIITVVRQVAEPHLVGKSIGLPPLLMLISFYVGFRLFGVAGIVLGPALAVLCKALLEYKESRA